MDAVEYRTNQAQRCTVLASTGTEISKQTPTSSSHIEMTKKPSNDKPNIQSSHSFHGGINEIPWISSKTEYKIEEKKKETNLAPGIFIST